MAHEGVPLIVIQRQLGQGGRPPPRPAGPLRRDRPRAVSHGDHGGPSPWRADPVAVAGRRLGRRARSRAAEMGARRVRYAEVAPGQSQHPMADRLAGELERLYQTVGEPREDALVFADPITGGPLDNTADLRRYRKVLTAAALEATHNLHGLRHTFARGWRRPAGRCASSRN